MAEGGIDTPRSRPGPGHSSYLALLPGIHPGLCLPRIVLTNWAFPGSQGSKAILLQLADRVHGGHLYQREKRNVVVDIWSKVMGKIEEVDLQPGRTVREGLAHPD